MNIFAWIRNMKNSAKLYLQKFLGFSNYLFIFSIFKILTLRWDKKENDFLYFLKLIPEDGIVLDIGANIGIMSIPLSKRVPKGMVYAFEPMPDNYLALQKVIQLFKVENIYVYRCALGDENKTIEMILPVQDSIKNQGLTHVVHDSLTEFNEGIKFSTLQRTLDSVANEIKIPFHAIKIDVENFEYFVFKGGMESLEKYRPIIYCELWDDEKRESCFEIMKELGYRTMVFKGKKLILFDKTIHDHQNFFFIPVNMTIIEHP
jgi:FkbM family methyltransferase